MARIWGIGDKKQGAIEYFRPSYLWPDGFTTRKKGDVYYFGAKDSTGAVAYITTGTTPQQAEEKAAGLWTSGKLLKFPSPMYESIRECVVAMEKKGIAPTSKTIAENADFSAAKDINRHLLHCIRLGILKRFKAYETGAWYVYYTNKRPKWLTPKKRSRIVKSTVPPRKELYQKIGEATGDKRLSIREIKDALKLRGEKFWWVKFALEQGEKAGLFGLVETGRWKRYYLTKRGKEYLGL